MGSKVVISIIDRLNEIDKESVTIRKVISFAYLIFNIYICVVINNDDVIYNIVYYSIVICITSLIHFFVVDFCL